MGGIIAVVVGVAAVMAAASVVRGMLDERAARRRVQGAQAAANAIAHQRTVAAQRVAAERRRQEALKRAKLNALARRLQRCLLTLDQAPDFRRAALFASQAKSVPAGFRQRQFRRFRPRLVEQMAGWLRAGGDRTILLESLTQLVKHLGIAAFEATYICAEAEQQIGEAPAAVQETFAARLQSLQHEHDERVATIRSLDGLNPELAEQMLETEDETFREALLRLQNDRGRRERR